jgi:hypothetical protein
MRAVSSRFDAAVMSSHTMTVECDVLFDGAVVTSGLSVSRGNVRYDRRAKILASASLEFTEPYRVPNDPRDVLTPFGFEVRLRAGIVYPDSTSETVPLGVFPIQTSRVRAGTLMTTVTALDRAQLVTEAEIEDPYVIAAGTNVAVAILNLVRDGLPQGYIETDFVSTAHTTPMILLEPGDDRWLAAQRLATSIGCELYFDGLGRLILRNEPSLADASIVWRITSARGLLDSDLELSRADAYNRVIARSSNSALDQVFRGVATDDDPNSPTQYGGPFGRKPRRYASPFIASDAQAQSAAEAILRQNVGIAKSLDLTAVPNHALEAGDVIAVDDAHLQIAETVILDQVTVGLSPMDATTAVTRTRLAAA